MQMRQEACPENSGRTSAPVVPRPPFSASIIFYPLPTSRWPLAVRW